METSNKLTIKQEMFCQEYMKSGSKTDAYKHAYNAENMKDETIHVKACELSKMDKITVRLTELKEQLSKRNEVTIDWVVGKLQEVAMKEETDRVPALDKLMKYLGGYEKDNKLNLVNEQPPEVEYYDTTKGDK
jgi:phage terminase small subunit